MSRILNKLALMTALITFAVATALADGGNLKDSISIAQETVISNTTLKPGTYEVAFDESASEVSILKGKRIIVTIKASIATGEKPVRKTEAYYSNTDKGLTLTKLVFKGDDRAVILDHENVAVSR